MYRPPFKKRSWAVLMALALVLILLPACSTAPRQTEVVRELPPVELMRDCPTPNVDVTSNGALASTLLRYVDALALCNIDKKALREWASHD